MSQVHRVVITKGTLLPYRSGNSRNPWRQQTKLTTTPRSFCTNLAQVKNTLRHKFGSVLDLFCNVNRRSKQIATDKHLNDEIAKLSGGRATALLMNAYHRADIFNRVPRKKAVQIQQRVRRPSPPIRKNVRLGTPVLAPLPICALCVRHPANFVAIPNASYHMCRKCYENLDGHEKHNWRTRNKVYVARGRMGRH